MKLTKESCDKLVLPDDKSDVVYCDDEVPRFGLRLRRASNGSVLRSWTVQYRTKQRGGGKPRIKLGDYPALSVRDAREQAKVILAKAKLGEDPGKRRTREILRVVANLYLEAKADEWAPRTAVEAKRYLTDKDYFGPLLSLPVDMIQLRDVADCLTVIRRECGAATAGRARSSLSSCFTWAMRNGRADANPVAFSDKPKTFSRERVLTSDELRSIWHACADDDHGRIVRLLILLPGRRSEIGGMAWPEFSDLDGVNPEWTLPKARSKNGRKHVLPLLPLALSIIKGTPRRVRDTLFGSRTARGFTDWSRSKALLDQRCGFADWTIHDLRRSAATHMAEQLAIAPHIVEEILNHVKGGVSAVYNRARYRNEVRAALAKWEDHIRALVDDGAKVLNFPQSA
jgi:integrase